MTSQTLEHLVRSSSLNSISWIFNAEKISNEINWVSISSEEISSNDLFLININDVNPKLILEAKRKKISGILIFGNSNPVINKSFGIPIVFVNQKINLREFQQELITLLLNQQVSQFEQRDRVHHQLSQLSADGDSFQEIINSMQEISGSGIMVQDKYLQYLAESSSPFLTDIWNGLLEYTSAKKNLPEMLLDRDKGGKQKSLFLQSMPGGISRYVTPINVRGVVRGYFSVINSEDKLDDLDKLVAQEGSYICAIEMSRAKAIRETEKKLQSDLLTALLTEGLDPREAKLWVNEMGIDLSNPHTCIQFSWDADDSESTRNLESLINGVALLSNIKIVVNPMSNLVVCFLQSEPEESRPNSAIQLSQQVILTAREKYPTRKIRCGVGNPAISLENWRSSFKEAGKSLSMAIKLKESNPLYYIDLSVYRLLLLLEDNPELSNLYQENLGKIIEQNENLELIPTLIAFFKHNQNYSATAKSLFIHRNTLNHRINRISEISGLDIDDSETRLALQLALKVHKMRETD